MPWVKNFLKIYWSWMRICWINTSNSDQKRTTGYIFFDRFKNQYVPQGNQWWPVKPKDLAIPLSDRVENSILNLLQKKQKGLIDRIDREICAEFYGICIPPLELMQICLESYAEPLPDQKEIFLLRSQDETTSRADEISKTINTLKYLAVKFDYRTEGENPLIWQDKEEGSSKNSSSSVTEYSTPSLIRWKKG